MGGLGGGLGAARPLRGLEEAVTAHGVLEERDCSMCCPLLVLPTQGPEFVRKHIFNKHAEKIEEVKKEVAFFNNFLTDAKRPALPEIKPAQPPGPAQSKIRSMGDCHT